MRVSIIIPAYNEERRIGKTLEAYSDYFELLRKQGFLDYEILVVINNTKDRTEEVVKRYEKLNKRIQHLNLLKGGKGYAIVEGFRQALKANNDLIGFVDADLATSPESFYMLIKEINNVNCTIASRYVQGSIINPKYTFRRVIVAKTFNFLVRALFFFSYKDTQCGAKLFDRKSTEILVKNTKMSHYAFDVEMLLILKQNGMNVKEVKTVWNDIGGSKIDLKKSSIQMILAILRLRVINSSFKRLAIPFKPIIGLIWRLIK